MTKHRITQGIVFSIMTMTILYIGLTAPLTAQAEPQTQVGATDVTGRYIPNTATAPDPIFVGAGDIANCDTPYAEATAKLLDVISGTIYLLGDNAYPDGAVQDFTNCFDPTWGRHRARMKPVPGNHEYNTDGAVGYYTYFGAAASPLDVNCTSDCKGYYSYELGAWHIIALNSEIAVATGSEQELWLRQDLAAHSAQCTLAYWHKPRFSSGEHQNSDKYQTLWAALYDYGADVVLNGHDHNYERFGPQNPLGEADARGLREFVVGTGGTDQRSFGQIQPNSEVRATDSWGVLQLTLHETSYDWEFIPIAGQSFRDAGSSDCVMLNQPQATVESRVAQSTDDAEEGNPADPIYLNSSDLELTIDPNTPLLTQTVGLRFSSLNIPRQVTVTRAYLEFTVDEMSMETTTLQIAGEAAGAALTYSATPANISQREQTTAIVTWRNIPTWLTIGEIVRTPDLAPIVQEIVNRPDWLAGNAIAFMIRGTGRRTAAAFDGNPQAAPLLHIEYNGAGVIAPYSVYLPVVQQSALRTQ